MTATVADSSFVLFVYPFLFETGEFDSRVETISTARCEAHEQSPLYWEDAQFPGQDMLAYVASYLNPPQKKTATARLWRLNGALEEVYGLAGRANWSLVLPGKGKAEIPFRFGAAGGGVSDFSVQLALFRVGVGFLTARVSPKSASLDTWLDFLHHFRFAAGQRKAAIRAERAVEFDEATQRQIIEPFFPEPARRVQPRADGRTVFNDLLESFLRTGRREDDPDAQWWSEVFVPEQLIPFAGLFVDGAEEADDLMLAYKLRNFFHSAQGDTPAPEDLAPGHASLLPYARRQRFVFSLDGGSFLACDAPRTHFFRTVLPEHLREQYFILFILSLHQRFLLMSLSHQVVERWLEQDEEARGRAFASIRATMLEFTARGQFTQVMQRDHHHRCYRKWQEVFQIDALHAEVRDEVREMHEHVQTRLAEAQQRLAEEQQRQVEQLQELFALLSVIFGAPALVIGFLGINIHDRTIPGVSLWIALAFSGGAMALAATVLCIVRWRRRQRRAGRKTPTTDA